MTCFSLPWSKAAVGSSSSRIGGSCSSTSQPDGLALAAGQAGVALDRHVQPQRVAADESAQADPVEGLQQFLVAQRGVLQVEVVAQAAMEQRHVLRQVADTALAVGRVDLGQADVVQQQASRLRVEQAAEQAQQGRLPAPLPPSSATRSPARMFRACTSTTGGLSPWARRTPSRR